MPPQSFNLARFLKAQDDCYGTVMEELRAGRKRSHWMWFIFPQLGALGRSETARYFGLEGIEHAQVYNAHPVLGTRLRECSALVLEVPDRSAHDIFGSPDDLKLCSSMTLFELAVPQEPVFPAVLARFYASTRDALTSGALQSPGRGR